MTFGLYPKGIGRKTAEIKIQTEFSLPTHSRIVNGNPVETCEPYSRDYMSETYEFDIHIIKPDEA